MWTAMASHVHQETNLPVSSRKDSEGTLVEVNRSKGALIQDTNANDGWKSLSQPPQWLEWDWCGINYDQFRCVTCSVSASNASFASLSGSNLRTSRALSVYVYASNRDRSMPDVRRTQSIACREESVEDQVRKRKKVATHQVKITLFGEVSLNQGSNLRRFFPSINSRCTC